MDSIKRIAAVNNVQGALATFEAQLADLVELIVAVQQIPAPTFAEAQRAAFVQERLQAAGLVDIHQDALHNVFGRYAAATPVSSLPPVILSAHSDTVFSADTDLTIRRSGRFIYGPGIGDNATGVAGLLYLGQTLAQLKLRLPTDVWFVANVGEEGLGDLRGMRAVVECFGRDATYLIIEGGLYGQISHQAIGVRRFRIEVTAPGGHSWGSFGSPSAIHQLSHIVVAIDGLAVPDVPKTTYNVGVVEGGTSVNSIAQSASLLLDLRSEDESELAKLVGCVEDVVAWVNGRNREKGIEVNVTMTQIGNRPAGAVPRQHRLVTWAKEALQQVGCDEVAYITSSTDANIPLSQEMTAVCVGLTKSGNAHRLDEYIDPTYLPQGLGQLLLLTLAAAGFEPRLNQKR